MVCTGDVREIVCLRLTERVCVVCERECVCVCVLGIIDSVLFILTES